MKSLPPAIATALFGPAILGIGGQVVTAADLTSTLLSLALLLLGLEQAHMAGADLRQVALVQRSVHDPRLKQFHRVILATVAGQLVGFYLVAAGYLGGGLMIILSSLIGFNLAAAIRLDPRAPEPVIVCRPGDRLDVLTLNGVAVVLGLLWLLEWGEPWPAVGILVIVLGYVGSKLASYIRAWRQTLVASIPHVSDAAQQHPQAPQQNQ